MSKAQTVLSDLQRGRIVDIVLKLEYPDDPGAALGKHTSVRRSGPDWGRMSAFDQRRGELNDRERCTDPKLLDILCDLVTASRPKNG
jgi:hypothetical protein